MENAAPGHQPILVVFVLLDSPGLCTFHNAVLSRTRVPLLPAVNEIFGASREVV